VSMGLDLARALDPVLLARDAGITPDPWQAELLRSTAPRILELAARQVGKTTTTGLIALNTAIYTPASLSLILSPSERQSAEMLRTINNLHGRLKGVPKLRSDSVMRMELDNGSRIIALPGSEKTTRGYAGVSLAVIDEASRVDDELIAAVRPMLATTQGRLIALTTPRGKRGWFYESWIDKDGPWKRFRITPDMCPRITRQFLAEELRALGPAKFSEEYNLEFRDDDEAIFPIGVIERAFATEIQPLWS
jgi:hypothetical protein